MTPYFDTGKLPAFAKHLDQPHPDRLHHYTGQPGLKGIIERSELWATKAQYMNDATEFSLGLDLAIERIKHQREHSKGEEELKLVKMFPRRIGIEYVNVFVACFCEQRDLLSQWRGYSGDAYGYSLAINAAKLRVFADRFKFGLAKCIYKQADQVEIIDQLIAHCLSIDELSDMQVEFERGLQLVSAFFKHHKFDEEQKWRIVSQVTAIDHEMAGFREGKSMLVPYFRVHLGQRADSAIEAATVGPCPHKELSQSSVAMMFIRNGLARSVRARTARVWPEVYSSEVPYRNW